jgi:transposase
MRQIHIAGEKLFVDYAGSTVPIVNALTGEISAAQIFVATLGASNYTFACATPHQTTADWIGAQVRALEFFGGVPRLIVPDQTHSLIKRPDRYEPEPNRTYEEFAKHYGCALLAARPAHPRDKPNGEPFSPVNAGYRPVMASTACWRGYVCGYAPCTSMCHRRTDIHGGKRQDRAPKAVERR